MPQKRHAVWTLTCSMDMDVQHGQSMLHVEVHVGAVCPCSCCMSMFMLHVNDHAACPCSCCKSMSMLHVHGHAACSCPCCMFMFILHVPLLVHATLSIFMSMSMLHVHVYVCPHVDIHGAFPCQHCIFKSTAQIWTCSMNLDV